MSDHDLEPLPLDVRALIETGRRGSPPSAAARQRLFARLESTLTVPPGARDVPSDAAGPTSNPPVAPGHAGTGLAALAKPLSLALSMFALGAVAGAGIYATWHGSAEPRWAAPAPATALTPANAGPAMPDAPRVAEQQAPVADVDAPQPTTRRPAEPATRATRSDAAAAATAAAPAPVPAAVQPPQADDQGRDADLAAERALIERARTALARRDGAVALETVELHARRFLEGKLAEERETIRIQALVVASRAEEAQTQAARFHERYPKSLFLPVIDRALAQSPGGKK